MDTLRATNITEAHLTLCGYVKSNEFMEAEKKFKEYLDECPQYKWTRQYMRMIERLLTFIQSTRNGNWQLYLSSLEDMCKDIFSMDRINYKRLLPVYIAEMSGLKFTNPAIYEKFIDGEFVIRKSFIPFTQIGVDHAGEQVNKLLKVSGGLEGITKNVNARDRLFLTAPFIGEIVAQMETAANVESNKRTRHYQLSPTFIDKFDRDIESLI